MAQSLAVRIAALESQMQTLQELPGRVALLEARVASLDAQFLQFRGEVKGEFSAVRQEFSALREEVRAGDEETRRYMRVLHEEVIARIKVIGEGRP